ncbi:MAG: hypothetical protein KKD44_25340 [Proteobacteria bacterium]|nr:hypothetical protein [Pseudomonadota bacterium]
MGYTKENITVYEGIVEQYKTIQPHYAFFARVIEGILSDALKTLGFPALIQARAKGIPNFAEKVIRKKALNSDPVNSFTDLCGTRVIVDHQDEIRPVCDFIRKNFEIDIENSLDAVDRLGTGEFGYRSVHFIVSLKPGAFDDRVKQYAEGDNALEMVLYQRRTSEECKDSNLSPGPKYKAEIQVRTLLQHAWAVFSHDRVYKSNFDVPHWLQRDVNRIAALLENADSEFSRAIRTAERYETQYGAYLNKDAREQKQNEIRAILKFDPDNMRLIHRLAQLSASLGEWNECRAMLKPVVDAWGKSPQGKKIKEIQKNKKDKNGEAEVVRDADVSALLTEYGRSLWKMKKMGRDSIEEAILLNKQNVSARLALAETYNDDDPDKAYDVYAGIYSMAHDEPHALEGLINCKARIDRNLDFIVPLLHNLESAIEICRKRADVGVYIPQAYYTIGFFSLLLDRPYESLSAYAKAVTTCDSLTQVEEVFLWFKQLKAALDGRLTDRKKDHFEWVYLYLLSAVSAKALKARKETPGKKLDMFVLALKKDMVGLVEQFDLIINGPVVIVAGGCRQDIEEDLSYYRPIFETAFEEFVGTVFCGGTQSGISGLVGDLKSPRVGSFQRLAFLPKLISNQLAIHPGYRQVQTEGKGFSPMESIYAWLTILHSGIDPSEVRLLGINGGPISAFEYRMALSMGAKTGIIKESGRAATAILDDLDWKDNTGLFNLPSDPQTVKCFIQGTPTSKQLDASFVESMARETHEKYRKNQNKRLIIQDPALTDWETLPEYLKKSNREFVFHIEMKLNAVGLMIAKIGEGEPVELTEMQIEKMAEIEHGRWNMERIRDGWKRGERDVVKKISPYLIPWHSLPEEVREWDRDPVRDIPERLKKYGYQLSPMNR